MNEQLQKFYRQSIEYTNTDECLDMPNKQVQRLILAKYAELIIRECLVILNQNNPRPPGTVILYPMDQDQHFDTGWQVAVETKQARIKQHFGVEE